MNILTYKALHDNKAVISIMPHPTKKNILNEPLLVLMINGETNSTHETYSAACDEIYNQVNNNPFTGEEFDVVTVVNQIVQGVIGNDGLTIEDFINKYTDKKCSYLENSVWDVSGRQYCPLDVSMLLLEYLPLLDGDTIAQLYNEQNEIQIKYIGDSLFT